MVLRVLEKDRATVNVLEKGSRRGRTLEAVHVVHTLPGEVFGLEAFHDCRTLSIVWSNNAEIVALVVILDYVHDCVNFLYVLLE